MRKLLRIARSVAEMLRKRLILVVAFLLGLSLGSWLNRNTRIVHHVLRCQHSWVYLAGPRSGRTRPQILEQEVENSTEFLLVGVFINTEEKTGFLYNDFSSETDIRFIFFTTKSNISLHNRQVVYLGLKASTEVIYLRMFRHVCQHYETRFNWFIFTESSFFVDIDKLRFLRNLNDSQEHLFQPEIQTDFRVDDDGQKNGSRNDTKGAIRIQMDHSTGKPKEYRMSNMDIVGMLKPGVILNRSFLRKLSSLTEACMNKGNVDRKCFQRRVRISWFNNFTSNEESLNPVICRTQYKDLLIQTMTADLSNNLECLYRLRVQVLSKRVRALSKKYKALQTKLNILQGFIYSSVYDKIEEIRTSGFKQKVQFGTMFTLGKSFIINSKVPWSLNDYELKGITRIIKRVMKKISNSHHENKQFHALYYGYVLNQPISGQQLRLNIFTNKERHTARSSQEFGALQSRMFQDSQKMTVTVVVPLAGRLQNFKQFMENLERNILQKHEAITILVVYFPETASSEEHEKIFDKYNTTYNTSTFTWLNLTEKFARARALQAAVDFYQGNKLFFFADVDLTFNLEFLQRCRDNTVATKRVYFPVMFKLFNPKILGFKLNSTSYFRSFGREVGDWALYSYGPVCIYRDDVITVGGFNVGIKEWGYEDIQFFEKFISRHNYDVIRAADPGLLHIYHAHSKCDVIKNNIQRLMCTGAMLNSLTSEKSAVHYLLNKNYFIL